MKQDRSVRLFFCVAFICLRGISVAQDVARNHARIDGYRGIWFTLNQFSQYGDKYSGGLGTYTAHHIPMAVYAKQVDKTFFVYGGTTDEKDRHLLCMIGSFDHKTQTVSTPVVVHDKQGVDDPHDNPSVQLDPQGYIWVFVSGRNTSRKGYKYRSEAPYSTGSFKQITEEVFTYPQPWYIPGGGFFHLFTKYTGVRELYFETSKDGENWSEDVKLAGIRRESDKNSGHYQVSNHLGNRIVTFFNWHPDGNVDARTNIYYVQTSDFGKTWQTVNGRTLELPLQDFASPALVQDYFSKGKNVYLCDMNFDAEGNPVCLYITSKGHQPGPQNGPREWRICRWNGKTWSDYLIGTSDHNYDMGSLTVKKNSWQVVAPTDTGPQEHGSGGEVVQWESRDEGKTWKRLRQVTRHSERNHNYVRRVVNGKAPFLYFWADGDPNKFSISNLYFGDDQGHVWVLPYRMNSPEEKPKQLY